MPSAAARALLALLLSYFACLAGCHTTRVPNERFTLAWRDANRRVQVRYSPDGLTWHTATFPAMLTHFGPGVAADPPGLTFLVAAQSPQSFRHAVWGIGTNNYSAFVESIATPVDGTMDGAPSLAYAGASKWLFAFRSQGNAKLMVYDSAARAWTDATPTLNVDNTGVKGRPSVAVGGGRVVLTWSREAGPVRELQVAVGDLDAQGAVTWRGGYPFPNTATGFGAVLQQHDLSHDHAKFVLGIMRPDVGASGPLQTHTLFVYDSQDGMSWAERTRLGAATPPNVGLRAMPVSLAAHSNGVLVVAHNPAPSPQLFRFDGSAWTLLTSPGMTPAPEPRTEVALEATGRP